MRDEREKRAQIDFKKNGAMRGADKARISVFYTLRRSWSLDGSRGERVSHIRRAVYKRAPKPAAKSTADPVDIGGELSSAAAFPLCHAIYHCMHMWSACAVLSYIANNLLNDSCIRVRSDRRPGRLLGWSSPM